MIYFSPQKKILKIIKNQRGKGIVNPRQTYILILRALMKTLFCLLCSGFIWIPFPLSLVILTLDTARNNTPSLLELLLALICVHQVNLIHFAVCPTTKAFPIIFPNKIGAY